MGTRSITVVFEDHERKNVLCTIYRQFDGYLSGHGQELKDILSGKKIINGISGETTKDSYNGMGCLSAHLIKMLKGDSIGGIYLYLKQDSFDYVDYVYEIYPSEQKFIDETKSHPKQYNKIMLKVDDYNGEIDNLDTTEKEEE